jgi:S-DNA-T family DNA segregation ATPase FtsK/SpoIIIE
LGIVIRVLTSSWIRRLLPLLIAAGFIAGFWPSLVRALGLGFFLPMVAALLLTWLWWRRRIPRFLRAWNRWLGIAAYASALLGILAFFEAPEDSLMESSLGGYAGEAIIRSPDATGALIVAGLVVLGTACVAPYFSRRAVYKGARGAKKTAPVLKQAKDWGLNSIDRLREFYWKHPVHENVVYWLKSRRAPKVRGIDLPPPPTTFETPTKVEEELREIETAPAEPVPAGPPKTPRATTPQMPLPMLGRWQLPSIQLLNETAQTELTQGEVEKRARKIEEALASYGVEARVVQMNVGPAVTQFGVEPGWDRRVKAVKEKDKEGNVVTRSEEVSRTRVKVERISSLANDLALALAAPSIRIEAPVPGTSLVGVEVPNSAMGTVSVREVLEDSSFQKLSSRSRLAVALGKGTAGEVAFADLSKMPHLLIAGATGSGKTVCLNSIIVSLLMHNIPDNLRFVMIDPKRVELIAFNGIPHLMTSVVTEGDKAVDILKWIEHEMDNRYRRLASVGMHNIERYNRSNKASKQMTYLVVVIDELADLMLARDDEVEPALCRLAQMGRAVGVHLVVATQRPSVDVITGLIKANFPTRISFAVVSQVDSRTVLDMVGAEKLLGRGDMLYLSPDASKPKRLQGCLTTPDEMERVVNFWREQARQQAAEIFSANTTEVSGEDPLLDQARRLAREHTQVSASFLQRQLRVGLGRAERLMQQLQKEDAGKPEQPEREEET